MDINDSTAFGRGSDDGCSQAPETNHWRSDPDQHRQVATLDRRRAEHGLDGPCRREDYERPNQMHPMYDIKVYNHCKYGLTAKFNKLDMLIPFKNKHKCGII